MPGPERTPQWWLMRTVTLVLWSVACAAIVAYTGDERFSAGLVLIFAAIILAIHVVLFAWSLARDRMGRRR